MKNKSWQMKFLILYLFFISFFNFTPFYIVAALGMIILTILNIIKHNKVRFTSYIIFEMFFIFYCFMYVLLGLSVSDSSTLGTLKTLCLNLAINFAITNTIKDMDDLKYVIKKMVPIATFACIFIIIYTGGEGSEGRIAHGVPRLFSDTNYTSMEVASWAMYASAISLLYFIKTKNKKYLIPYPLFLLLVVWSGSRKCLLLTVILQFTIYLGFDDKINFKKIIPKVTAVVVLSVIGIYALFNVPILYEKVGNRIEGFLEGTEGAANAREENAEKAKVYISQNPLIGYGLGSFSYLNNSVTWTENNYLEITMSGGIILATLYYAFMLNLIYKLFKIRNKDYINKLFMFIILFICIFDIMTVSFLGRLETFLITIGSLLVYLDKKENLDETKQN